MSQKKVFLITDKCLDAGDRVIAASRHSHSLSFSNTHEHNYLAVDLDVCSQNTIGAAFSLTIATFGRVDVVVNNAGYDLCIGMDINFMGAACVTRAAIRIMRDTYKNMSLGQRAQALPAYNHVQPERIMEAMRVAQVGDPIKGATAMYALTHVPKPPLRCLLGSEAFAAMEGKSSHNGETYREFESIALPVDVDEAP
ncbi:hypothetical protein GGR55DRAFT_691316 [Xylaria sp. FL0064]|nr:hypothetical protein GGR55DRAFT_691316 [Xylaria sp. FL0064]